MKYIRNTFLICLIVMKKLLIYKKLISSRNLTHHRTRIQGLWLFAVVRPWCKAFVSIRNFYIITLCNFIILHRVWYFRGAVESFITILLINILLINNLRFNSWNWYKCKECINKHHTSGKEWDTCVVSWYV